MNIEDATITSDEWSALDKDKKLELLNSWLLTLVQIDENRHPFQKQKQHGKLRGLRGKLERTIKNIISWEQVVTI